MPFLNIYFVEELEPGGLHLIKSIRKSALKLPGEQRVDIQRVFARRADELLVCDSVNKSVKSLRVWSNEVAVVFQESQQFWKVFHAREMVDRAGDLLVVLESDEGDGDQNTRVCLARKQAGKYQTAEEFTLEGIFDVRVRCSHSITI